MCLARKNNTQMSEELSSNKSCLVSDSLKKIYSNLSDELLGTSWIMHLLRKLEDGIDVNIYTSDDNLKKSLLGNLSKITKEEKLLIQWKINSLIRNKISKDNKILQLIIQNI